MLISPTSGKTLLAQTLANFACALAVPMLAEAGYVGEDVETSAQTHQNADYDIQRAEHGIIYIDEIDKISSFDNPLLRDVSGEVSSRRF